MRAGRSLLAGVAVAMGILSATTAQAERYVVVNGQRMNGSQIAMLEQLRCGPVPNGSYWLNTVNGAWGYAGNPIPQGNIRDNCAQRTRRPSLSERGLLYSPGELLR